MIASRMRAQLLSGAPAKSIVAVVERLLAVQAQDPRGARLAIRARSSGLSAADVDRALTEDRTLVITTLNRGTLHLVRSEDYWWLHPLTAPPVFTVNALRLKQEGVTPAAAERGVTAIVKALTRDGPLTRADLREHVRRARVPVTGQALVHVLLLASLRGLTVRGPMIGGDQAHVLTRDWIGAPPAAMERDAALGLLARRYLAGHGPATDRDLARWAKVPLRDARRGLTEISADLVEAPDGSVELAGRRPARALPPPRLLGQFDPLLLGWVSRLDVLGDRQDVVTVNGIFRAFALVAGRAVATWTMPAGKVQLDPFRPLSRAEQRALDLEAADVVRFLTSPASGAPSQDHPRRRRS